MEVQFVHCVVGSLVVRAGLRVLGNSSGSKHSKAKLCSSSHSLQEKHRDIRLRRFHSCKKKKESPKGRRLWMKMVRLVNRQMGEEPQQDGAQHVSQWGPPRLITENAWACTLYLATTKCFKTYIHSHEFNIKPMNVSTFKAVLCTAGLSKVEPAFEKFPVSYGSVLE